METMLRSAVITIPGEVRFSTCQRPATHRRVRIIVTPPVAFCLAERRSEASSMLACGPMRLQRK